MRETIIENEVTKSDQKLTTMHTGVAYFNQKYS